MAVAFSEHEAQQTWARVMTRARAQLPDATVVMWFDEVRPISLTDDVLELAVPSSLIKERLAPPPPGTDRGGRGRRRRKAVEDRAGRRRHAAEPGRPLRARRGHDRQTICTPTTFVTRSIRRDRCPGRPFVLSGAQPAARGPGASVPELHLRRVRAGAEQPVRARGRHGGRRGSAVDRVQPVVHLRGRGPRQDAPADRGRPSHVPPRTAPCA